LVVNAGTFLRGDGEAPNRCPHDEGKDKQSDESEDKDVANCGLAFPMSAKKARNLHF
jgi:hypothetical protein